MSCFTIVFATVFADAVAEPFVSFPALLSRLASRHSAFVQHFLDSSGLAGVAAAARLSAPAAVVAAVAFLLSRPVPCRLAAAPDCPGSADSS